MVLFMFKEKVIIVAFATSLFVTGCANIGSQDEALNGVNSAASSVSSAVSGLFAGYENGTKIEDKYLASLITGKATTKDIEQAIGFPANKETMKSGISWRYPYTKISHFGANVNETTIFEFNKKGILKKAYKANGRTDKTGNALVDSAN